MHGNNFAQNFPTDCAGMGQWAACSNDCSDCPKCVPDEKTKCGQMMIASGIDCAPENCHPQCCKKQPQMEAPTAAEAEESKDKTKPFWIAGIVLGSLLILLLLANFLMKRYRR